MLLSYALGAIASLSLALLFWQWWLARRFPLHAGKPEIAAPTPGVTVLKPLKGRDHATLDCLESWLKQEYPGPVQLIFGVTSDSDPAVAAVRELLLKHPQADATLVITGPPDGVNAKVAKLAIMNKSARHPNLVISDADVLAPAGCLTEVIARLEQPTVGLVNCFYNFANPQTPAMQWEAAAVNVDFWSQVLQSCSLKPMDFALGAVMAVRKNTLAEIGGFEALRDCLADDYQLGNRIALKGHRILLASTVVSCFSGPVNWLEVWKHQVRWARTIRVCQPVPYFFSILSNPTLWALIWAATRPTPLVLGFSMGVMLLRMIMAADLDRKLSGRSTVPPGWILLKDVLQAGVWFAAFAGNTVEWRGERYRLARDGTIYR